MDKSYRKFENLHPQNSVFGLSGSPRINGNSDSILKEILVGVSKANVPASYLNLSKIQFKGWIGCERCRKIIFILYKYPISRASPES